MPNIHSTIQIRLRFRLGSSTGNHPGRTCILARSSRLRTYIYIFEYIHIDIGVYIYIHSTFTCCSCSCVVKSIRPLLNSREICLLHPTKTKPINRCCNIKSRIECASLYCQPPHVFPGGWNKPLCRRSGKVWHRRLETDPHSERKRESGSLHGTVSRSAGRWSEDSVELLFLGRILKNHILNWNRRSCTGFCRSTVLILYNVFLHMVETNSCSKQIDAICLLHLRGRFFYV